MKIKLLHWPRTGRQKWAALLLGLVLLVLLTGVVVAQSGALASPRSLVQSSGGGTLQNGPYVLNGSIGQNLAGKINRRFDPDNPYQLQSGYWSAGSKPVTEPPNYTTYLPGIIR